MNNNTSSLPLMLFSGMLKQEEPMQNKSATLFMKILISVSLLLVSVLFQNKVYAQDTIYWRSNYKLRWEDFQGKPDAFSNYGAVGSPGISYSLAYNEDSFSTKVLCYFIKSKAWSKFKTSDTLLQHEQVHFDIVELFARKLRKSFTEYKFNPKTVNLDLKNIFLRIKQQKDSLNAAYDRATDFSRDRKQQLLWNKKIRLELDKLKRYCS
jgi:hypothetical protein